jgi:hypothetical protein
MFSPFIINLFSTIIISIIIVTLLHYLWEYIKDTYSTKKVKDLVNTQIEKYKNIASTNIIGTGSPKEDFLTEIETASMQEELQNFITSVTETVNE